VHEGVCIAAGVAAVGGGACEQRNEKGVHGGMGYVIGVGAEWVGGRLEARWKASFTRRLRSRR
jgi:hypothetical protein